MTKKKLLKNPLRKRVVAMIGAASLLIYLIVIGVLSFHSYRLERSKYQLLSEQISHSVQPHVMSKDEIGIRSVLSKIMESSHLVGISIHTHGIGTISKFKDNAPAVTDKQATFSDMITDDVLSFSKTYQIYPNGDEKFDVQFFYENTSRITILFSAFVLTLLIFAITLFVIIMSRRSIDSEILRRSVDEEKSNLAARIFHLIRSDVVQLNNLINRYHGTIRKEDRVLVKSITGTILGTAGKFINSSDRAYNTLDRQEQFSLVGFIEEVISRKLIEYPDRKDIKMDFLYSQEDRHLTIKSIRSELQMAVSNIINNSFEALSSGGTISLAIKTEGNLASLIISDNGPGLDEEKISKILKGGHSFNKESGNGMGIKQSVEIIDSLGGELTIDSAPGKGMATTITLLSEAKSKDRYTQEEIASFDAILIEDSKVRRINFEKQASVHGALVGTFSGFVELKKYLNKYKFNRDTPVFTDSDLGETQPGEVSAQELFHRYGFKHIKVITAGDVDTLKEKKMPWISDIIGKHQDYQYFHKLI